MTNRLTSLRLMMIAGVVCAGMLDVCHLSPGWAQETPPAQASDEATRRAAAVTLNYARASFHRIRRNPTVRVLNEEQEKILNRLNLNGILDEEVLKLYSSVLDEIAQIQLSERERVLLRGKHSQGLQASLGFNALALTLQMATAQYASAVRTGASSWWDFRNYATNRDLDLHRIEKERMNKIVEKSSRFLDVSWKMARDKNIPDRWLVRGDDLDKLEEAWKEPDLETRLRVLKRMEPFMECYPPYWYYVARTEQALGKMPIAAETFGRMANLGSGHFRRDEMLAAGLANRALIQAYLADPEATATAQRALECSDEVWEANLICASVLQRGRQYEAAEDAILRNLDVERETVQSRLALVTLYYDSDNRSKLAKQLSQLEIATALPPLVLAQCAARLGDREAPPVLAQVLERSLQATPRFNIGKDDLVIQATSNWQLERARIKLTWGDGAFVNPRLVAQPDQTVVATFEGIGEFYGRSDVNELTLTLEYPDAEPLKLTLSVQGTDPATIANAPTFGIARRAPVYRVAGYEQTQMKLTLQAGTVHTVRAPAGPVLAQPLGDGLSQTKPVTTTTFKPTVADSDPFFETPEIAVP